MFSNFLSKYSYWVFSATLIFITALYFSENQRFVVWNQITSAYFDLFADDYGRRAFAEQEVMSKRFFKLGAIPNLSEKMQLIKLTDYSPIHKIPFDHIPRKSLIYPLIFFTKTFNLEINAIFTLFVYFILFLTALTLSYSLYKTNKLSPKVTFPYVFLVLLILSFFMNGRMTFSLLSSSIFLFLLLLPATKNKGVLFVPLLVFLAAYLSSISTGTFTVMYTSLSAWTLYNLFKKRVGIALLCAVPLLFWLAWYISAIYKNIAFFGSDLMAPLRMLNHGYGKFLTSFWVIPILIGLFFVWKMSKYILHKNLPVTFYAFLAVSLGGGLFGYSTLTVIIPFLIFLTFIKLESLDYCKSFPTTYSPIAKEAVAPGDGAL